MEGYWIWLAEKQNIPSRVMLRLLEEFPDPEAIHFAGEDRLKQVKGMTANALSGLLDKDLGEAKKIISQCRSLNIGILTYGMEAYPDQLRQISDPPLVLYYKGSLPELNHIPLIGAVGTRKGSPYGVSMARRMGYQIASCGATVVSGMARGEDAEAMRGALLSGGGVIAVLGCGVDVVYPPSNRKLYEDTVAFGCVMSEYPPETEPLRWHFPRRNRIISGLSSGVLVVEAPEKSGALITASHASEQGRDVFVLPGNIDVASCAGSNSLLRQGAIAVTSGWDVVSEYASRYPGILQRNEENLLPPESENTVLRVAQERKKPERPTKPHKPSDKKVVDNMASSPYSDEKIKHLPQEQQAILRAIHGEERPIDDVIAESGLPSAKALSVITLLELKGMIRRISGQYIGPKRSI